MERAVDGQQPVAKQRQQVAVVAAPVRGIHEPLAREDIRRKFNGNARYGGWPASLSGQFLEFAERAFDGAPDLAAFRR